MDGMGQEIVDIVNHYHGRKVERITAFTEFFGPSSFAGSHEIDEPKQLVLFDVFVFKKGFIPPRQFSKLFSHKDWGAKVVYDGNVTHQFIRDIYDSKYDVDEGVICKGDGFSFKVKTSQYLDRLKSTFMDDWEQYGE